MSTPSADGQYLRDLLATPFTDEQLAVATAPLEPQLVIAGAGSGKTTVMAARVVHAVRFHGIPASAVLGLTFTNKAAAQLAASVRRALLASQPKDWAVSGGLFESPEVDDAPTIATYNAYAAAIVRDHALRIGREPATTLITQAARWQLAMRVVRRAVGPFEHLTWQPASVATFLLDLDGELAEHLCEADQVRAFDARFLAELEAVPKQTVDLRKAAAAANARDQLLELVEAYRAEKWRLDLVDYGDQVSVAAEIAAQSAEVCRLESERYQLVLLDEYQDTGHSQRVLLSTLFGGAHSVTAVGDPNQSIFGWRGASVGNLINFLTHFGKPGAPLALMTSFRCGGRVLGAANCLSEPLRKDAGSAALEVEPLRPKLGEEDAGRVVVALHERIDDEAEWVARRVDEAMRADAVEPGSVAVLCRRRTDFPLLHQAFVARGIPVEVVGLGGLLEMPEVADVVSILRVLIDPTANAAMLRIVTGPRWRIGPRDLAAIGRRARALVRVTGSGDRIDTSDVDAVLREATDSADLVDVPSLSDAIDDLRVGAPDLSPDAVSRLLRLRAELDALRDSLSQPVVELASEIIRRTGLDVELEIGSPQLAAARLGHLATFLDHAAKFAGVEGETDLPSFLGWLDAAAREESGLDVGVASEANTVKLMTVHKAKGLEWDIVAVPGLTKGVFPSERTRQKWSANGYVLPFPCRGDEEELPHLVELSNKGLKAFGDACKKAESDEERRLGYVAVTRGRSLVLASGYWWGETQSSSLGPSTLLTELHELVPSGVVDADVWVAESQLEANPFIAVADLDVAWPPPSDKAAAERRWSAAAAVATAQRAGEVTPADGLDLVGADRARVQRWDEEARLLLDEIRRSRVAVREVALPRRLTASQVVSLAQGADAFAASLARPMPSRPQPQARRGSRFHRWVEELYGASPLLEPDDLPGASDADLSDLELAELQARFLADGWGDRRPVAVEAGFELVVGGRLVRGRIDAVYPTGDGGYDVIDYKTGAVPRDFEAASLQLAVYRLAWADLQGIDVSSVDAGFLYVRTGEVKRPAQLLTRTELERLFAGDAPALG
jgi:DNA helicase II / ATP-dependent DNA helicase PcrA